MSRAPIFVAASAVVACAQLVGIGDFPGAKDAGTSDAPSDVAVDAPSSLCTNTVITSASPIDSITATASFVFTQTFDIGVARCPSGSTCTNPPLVSLTDGDTFRYAAMGSSLVYSALSAPTPTVHRAGFDGTNDVTLLTTSLPPSLVALGGGGVTFWVAEGQPDEVHCIGCAGADAVWIENVTAPTALFADSASVYVLAQDSSSSTYDIFGCSTKQACATQPVIVIQGLAQTTVGATNVASDGARVYVPRFDASDIVAIDGLGDVKTIATGVHATALAVDGISGDVFYGTDTGTVARVRSDGTGASTLSACGQEISAISFDATRVYALVTDNVTKWVVYAFSR